MFKESFLTVLVFFCAVFVFAQSPYGRILTLDNSGTQQWIDIVDVITNYFEYHSNTGFPAWLTNGNVLTGSEKLGSTNNYPLIFVTNDTERMRITGAGNVGVGTDNPAEKLDVAGNVRFSGALMPNGSAGTSGQLLMSQGAGNPPVWSTVTFSETDPIFSSWIDASGSANNNILRFNGTKYAPVPTGNLTTTTSGVTITGGSNAVIGTGTTINIATASETTTGLLSSTDWTTFNNKENALTFNSPLSRDGNTISIPQASSTTDGYLSSDDWTTFNNKLSSTLNSGYIFVGNSSNVATGVAMSGDATISNTGVATVTGLQGRSVATTAPTDGQVLTWNNGENQWEPQTPTPSWSLTGNILTGSEKIGSTNEQPVVMITDNTNRFRFTTKGQIEVLNSAQSVFLGEGAGANQDNSGNRWNVFVGYQAGNSNTTGDNNTANGYGALYSNTTGFSNTASGAYALYSNTTGNYNTASGWGALYSNKANSRSTAIGYRAMYYADNRTTGRETYNTAVGYEALRGSTTAANNIGQYNTAIGDQALFSNASGFENTASGHKALYSNTYGYRNTASGTWALYSNTYGSWNTASGAYALFYNTEGHNNTASGAWALYHNTSGDNNTASGRGALYSNTTGSANTASGFQALYYNRANSRSTAIGYQAMYYADNRTTGRETYNTAVGYEALRGSTTASSNTGRYNTAIGDQALFNNTSGWGNTATGMRALYNNTTGSNNTALGDSAGYNLTTGSNNILIGYNAQPSSNTIDNEVTLGNSSNNSYRMYADSWTNASDARYKHDIADLPYGLEFILKLRPRQYIYNNSTDNKISIGFVAQEVQEVMRQYDMHEKFNLVKIMEQDYLGLNTTQIIPILVKAVQELSAENEELKRENDELKSRIERLERIVLQGDASGNSNLGSAK